MQVMRLAFLIIFVSLPALLFAQNYQLISEDLKERLAQSINNKHYDKIADLFHHDAIVVLGNTHIFHNRAELNQFLNTSFSFEKMKVNKVIVNKIHINSNFISLSKDAFIATGTATFVLSLTRGKTIEVPIRWVATIVNKQGKWLITSYQESIDMFDNPIMIEMRYDFYMICFLALIIGFIMGFTWKRLIRKFK